MIAKLQTSQRFVSRSTVCTRDTCLGAVSRRDHVSAGHQAAPAQVPGQRVSLEHGDLHKIFLQGITIFLCFVCDLPGVLAPGAGLAAHHAVAVAGCGVGHSAV